MAVTELGSFDESPAMFAVPDQAGAADARIGHLSLNPLKRYRVRNPRRYVGGATPATSVFAVLSTVQANVPEAPSGANSYAESDNRFILRGNEAFDLPPLIEDLYVSASSASGSRLLLALEPFDPEAQP